MKDEGVSAEAIRKFESGGASNAALASVCCGNEDDRRCSKAEYVSLLFDYVDFHIVSNRRENQTEVKETEQGSTNLIPEKYRKMVSLGVPPDAVK